MSEEPRSEEPRTGEPRSEKPSTTVADKADFNVASVHTAFALPSVTVPNVTVQAPVDLTVHPLPTELEALHRATVTELKERANVLLTVSASRIRRYQWTKFGCATLLLGSLLGLVYSNSPQLGLEMLALRLTPIALFFGLLFYLADNYLRDHEVASRAAHEGEKLLNAARQSEAAWTFAKDAEGKKKVVKELMDQRIDTSSIIAAEQAGKVPDLIKVFTEYSQALIQYRQDKALVEQAKARSTKRSERK
jgi:hypothetical protein